MLLLFWIPILLRESNLIYAAVQVSIALRFCSSGSSVGIRARCAHRFAFRADDGTAESSVTTLRMLTVGWDCTSWSVITIDVLCCNVSKPIFVLCTVVVDPRSSIWDVRTATLSIIRL
jgi:hypothetical protein